MSDRSGQWPRVELRTSGGLMGPLSGSIEKWYEFLSKVLKDLS